MVFRMVFRSILGLSCGRLMALRRPDSDDSLGYVPNPLAVDFNVEAVVARLGHRRGSEHGAKVASECILRRPTGKKLR